MVKGLVLFGHPTKNGKLHFVISNLFAFFYLKGSYQDGSSVSGHIGVLIAH